VTLVSTRHIPPAIPIAPLHIRSRLRAARAHTVKGVPDGLAGVRPRRPRPGVPPCSQIRLDFVEHGPLPTPAVPVIAASPEQEEQYDDDEDGFHGLFPPVSRYTEHEPCRSRNRIEQAKTAVKRRLPSSQQASQSDGGPRLAQGLRLSWLGCTAVGSRSPARREEGLRRPRERDFRFSHRYARERNLP
jgi:hypothetical protein